MGGRGKGHQGTYIKDTWTKPKGVGPRVEGGEGTHGGVSRGGKGRQLYLNNNKKIIKKRVIPQYPLHIHITLIVSFFLIMDWFK